MTLEMRHARNIRRIVLLLCGVSLLVGCAALVPTIRDDYMGKSLLQPHKVPQPVEYDKKGNAIPQEKEGWLSRIFPFIF